MKNRKLFWALTAAAVLVTAFAVDLSSGLFGILSLPFTALGWALRNLSLCGAVGNVAAIVIYGLVCAVPVWFWWRSRRRTEDWLLLLMPLVLAVVLYYMINPNLRPALMQNSVGDAVYATSGWAILMTWALLKLLYSAEWGLERNIYKILRIFLLVCAAGCLIECFGVGTARILYTVSVQVDVMGRLMWNTMDIGFTILAYLVVAVENCFAALVLCRGAKLLEMLELDPFGEESVKAADGVCRLCRDALAVMCLCCLLLNLVQILMTPLLNNISVSVSIPVTGLTVCFAMLAVTKLLVRGKELKDETDLFI